MSPDLGVWVHGWPVIPTADLPVVLTGAVLAVVAVGAAGILVRRVVRAVARRLSGTARADLLTYVTASIATSVAATGMWRVFRDVLHIDPVLRVGMFGFIELAVLTSAVRARQSMRDRHSAGADGIAVWVLTCLSAALSAMDARSAAEAVFRLAAPLVAAWLWERGLHVERRRLTGRSQIHWRITPERILVRLRLAESSERTAGQIDVERHLTRLAMAAHRARRVQEAGLTGRRHRRALNRLDTAMRRAVAHTALSIDAAQQQRLLGQLAALNSGSSLLARLSPAPWDVPTIRSVRSGLFQAPVVGESSDVGAVGGADRQLVADRSSDRECVDGLDRGPVSAGSSDREPGREQVGGPVSAGSTDCEPVSGRSVDGLGTAAARPRDLDRLRAAIEAGELPAQPTAKAIRIHLAIGARHARAARNAYTAERQAAPSRPVD